METLSKQIARVEKELGFWRDLHREELQKELGEDFLIRPLMNQKPYSPMRNYFFPIEYNNKPFGIILPFRERRKVIFASPSNKDVYKSASKIFSNRGYKIQILPNQIAQGDEYCLTIDEDVFDHAGEL